MTERKKKYNMKKSKKAFKEMFNHEHTMTERKGRKIKAALEWAESFYANIKNCLNDDDCPKEIILAISALQIIIEVLKENSNPPEE